MTKVTFANHSKKNSEYCPSNRISASAMTSASDEEWRPFNCFFSRVGLRIYQHPSKFKNNFINLWCKKKSAYNPKTGHVTKTRDPFNLQTGGQSVLNGRGSKVFWNVTPCRLVKSPTFASSVAFTSSSSDSSRRDELICLTAWT